MFCHGQVIGSLLVDSIDYCVKKRDIGSVELRSIAEGHWQIINYSTV